jgi:4-hydroxybutyrate CoA-transferase
MSWQETYQKKRTTADAAIAATVKSGRRIFLTGNCSVPHALVNALVAYAPNVVDVEIAQTLTVGPPVWAAPELEGHLHNTIGFIGPNMRKHVWEKRVDFVPVLLSEFNLLFRRGVLPLDVAFVHLSPPDEKGYCSFAVETGLSKTPAESSKVIVAQINSQMPYILGDSLIHVDAVDYIVECDDPLDEFQMAAGEADPIADKIARNIAALIPDGATLQVGIGAMPDLVLHYLEDKRDLGIHTELISDGVKHLVELGVITGARKTLNPGKITAGFVLGSKELCAWLDHNPIIDMRPTEYVNDPCVVGQNYRQVAINGAIEVDITGQVCADSFGPRIYSGVGGQVDFIYGAGRSEGGMPIIALPSTAQNDRVSRIVPMLKEGAGVVTTRNHVHWVVTEYGSVDLFGKSIRQRVDALASIAHPRFREMLKHEAKKLAYV